MASSDSSQTQPISDPYASLGLIKNSDNSFTRLPEFMPATAACSDPASPTPVLTKDIPINPQNNTWARLYIPRRRESAAKLPLIVFYHGGAFVLASAATTLFQKFCCDIVLQLPAVMVSVEYRLAPEHRLPAAYDDCMEALHWVKAAADEWLTEHADFSKCFIMGNSAGGNIALHVGLRVATQVDKLMPLRIQGLILHQPFFGGVERTPSEIRLTGDNKVMSLDIIDVIWDLTLPIGVDRDHEYSNPMKHVIKLVEAVDKVKSEVKSEGWRVLVTGYEGDPFIDRQIEVAKMLREKGVFVVEDFREGGYHGLEFYDDSNAHPFYHVLNNFLLAV